MAELDRLMLRQLLYAGLFDGATAVFTLFGAVAYDDTLIGMILAAAGALLAWSSGASFATRRALSQQLAHTEEVVASVEPSQRPALLARLNEGAVAYGELWRLLVPVICALVGLAGALVVALVRL